MMSSNADVRSLEQLETLLEHSKQFRSKLLQEIENLQVELARLTGWIESEAIEYWRTELAVATRRYKEAQDTLSRCMSYVREDERRPCTEEKKRVQRAKRRRDLCEEKLKTARGAATAWERDRRKSQSKIQRSTDLAEADLSVAIVHLESQIANLREYAGLRSPSNRATTPSQTAEDRSNRPLGTEQAGQLEMPQSDSDSGREST